MAIRNGMPHILILLRRILVLLRLVVVCGALVFKPVHCWRIIFEPFLTFIWSYVRVLVLNILSLKSLSLSWWAGSSRIKEAKWNWNLSFLCHLSLLPGSLKMALSFVSVLLLNYIKASNILLALVRIKSSLHKVTCGSSMHIKIPQTLLDIYIFELFWYDVEVNISLSLVIWLLLLQVKLLSQEYDLIFILSKQLISLILVHPWSILNLLGSWGIPQWAHSFLEVRGAWPNRCKH